MKTEHVTTLKRQAPKLLKELREGLARGEKAILEDRIVSHDDAKKRMARWLE